MNLTLIIVAGLIVVLVSIRPLTALFAWAMWLVFVAIVVRAHGLEGFKAMKTMVADFRLRDWALLVPSQVITAAISAIASTPTATTGLAEDPAAGTEMDEADTADGPSSQTGQSDDG